VADLSQSRVEHRCASVIAMSRASHGPLAPRCSFPLVSSLHLCLSLPIPLAFLPISSRYCCPLLSLCSFSLPLSLALAPASCVQPRILRPANASSPLRACLLLAIVTSLFIYSLRRLLVFFLIDPASCISKSRSLP